jgi:hypothetical protein
MIHSMILIVSLDCCVAALCSLIQVKVVTEFRVSLFHGSNRDDSVNLRLKMFGAPSGSDAELNVLCSLATGISTWQPDERSHS